MLTWNEALLLRCVLLLSLLLHASIAEARPETIRAGVSYYSDDFVVSDSVHDIAGEKNYEEVYQFYSYYEAIYDETDRVVVFVEYRRGEVRRREQYAYGEDGALLTRSIERPGKPPEIIPVEKPVGGGEPEAP